MSTSVTAKLLATAEDVIVPVSAIAPLRELNIARVWDENDIFGGQRADGYQLGSVDKKTGKLSGLIAVVCALAHNSERTIVWPEDRMVTVPGHNDPEIHDTPNGNRRASCFEVLENHFTNLVYAYKGDFYTKLPDRDGQDPKSEIDTIDFCEVNVRVTALPERPDEKDLFILMADHERNNHEPGEYGKWVMRKTALDLMVRVTGEPKCLIQRGDFASFMGWSDGFVQRFLYLICMPYAEAHEEALRQIASGVKAKEVKGKLKNDQIHELWKLFSEGKLTEADELYEVFMSGKKPISGVRSRSRDDLTKCMKEGYNSPLMLEGVRFAAGDVEGHLPELDAILLKLGDLAVEGNEEGFLALMPDIARLHQKSQEAQDAFLLAVNGR